MTLPKVGRLIDQQQIQNGQSEATERLREALQNAIQQAEQFRDAAGVTGLALTKLDGTAKGGILFALAKRTGLPIRFIGVGERLEDLRPFHAEEFVQALFEDVTG